MGVAKSSRFKDLVHNLWEGVTAGVAGGGAALEKEGRRVFELLDGVKITPQYLVNLDDRYNSQIANLQSIDALLTLQKNLDTARLALEAYLAACKGSKGKWTSHKAAAEEVLTRFSPLFLGIELKLFQLAEAEMRKCGGKLSGLLSAKKGFELEGGSKKRESLLDALCEFQSVTFGDDGVACADPKKMRQCVEGLLTELPEAAKGALQHVVSKRALLGLIERFSDEFKSEKMVKIAGHFSKGAALHVEPDASASAIVVQCDKKGKLNVVVSLELVTSVPRDGGSEELARGIYEVELTLSPARNGEYELKQLTMVPSEQVV